MDTNDEETVEQTEEEPTDDEPTEEEDELKASEPKVSQLPEISQEEEEDREDLDGDLGVNTEKDEEIKREAEMKSLTFGGNITEVMNTEGKKIIGEKIDEDLSRYNSIERIKEYLTDEIGQDLLNKAHPILKEFGDDILYENNIPLVIDQLDGILSEEEVVRYLHFFATLIFFENEQEKINKRKQKKPAKVVEVDDDDDFKNVKKLSQKSKPNFAIATFKGTPKDDSDNEDNIFKNYADQNPSFDMTANFGL